jgi:outer membrane protein OmpA-like peptidoglycan-associated protein
MKKVFLFLLGGAFILNINAQSGKYKNLFDYENGARVVDFSSNYGGSYDAKLILKNAPTDVTDRLPAWCSAAGAPFPHHLTIELSKTEWLNIIEFNNELTDEVHGYPGISAKDVEVYVSTTSAKSGFKHSVSFRLEQNKNNQLVKITPVQAHWVKLVITSNYGDVNYTEFGQLGAYDDGIRSKGIKDEMSSKGFADIYGIYFDFGSPEIKEESMPVIAEIVSYLNENPEVKIIVEGHTDNVGNESSNQKLSENRAKTVMDRLTEKGINKDRLSVKGYGSNQPVSDNDTETGRAQNRRVTIRKVN